LGAGFELQYTARENIYLYGAVLGYRREFIEEKFDEIIEFSGLEKFVDVPIQNYSSGMRTRLGFAICTAVQPDILILDEVFSVGDAKFRRKSEKRIIEMFDTNVTVLFVSHNLGQVMRICNKAIILDHGKLIAEGDIGDVAPIYEQITGEIKQQRREERRREADEEARQNGAQDQTPQDGTREPAKGGLSQEEMNSIIERYKDFD
ncbi:MAG: ABC transporter ATP-binding protein, partial [Lachnospiraceae bacterium]|nr:ABC transporter ATP-binding protein [Lachnospiraceae bacterium]